MGFQKTMADAQDIQQARQEQDERFNAARRRMSEWDKNTRLIQRKQQL